MQGGPRKRALILVVDNYDSFTMNLVQPLRAWGLAVTVLRNDVASVAEMLALKPERILLSPGPNRPEQAGVCVDLARAAGEGRVPLLGVCLGHQCLAVAYGATVHESKHPLHGRSALVRHDGQGVFADLPSPLRAGRYHSLAVDPELPPALVATAWADDGTLMGIRHRILPLAGIQFHPESYLTPHGERLLRTFVARDFAPA